MRTGFFPVIAAGCVWRNAISVGLGRRDYLRSLNDLVVYREEAPSQRFWLNAEGDGYPLPAGYPAGFLWEVYSV